VVMSGVAENDICNALVLTPDDVARRGADSDHLAFPAADPRRLFQGYMGHAGEARRHRDRYRAAVRGAFDPAPHDLGRRRVAAREAEVAAAIEAGLTSI